MWFGVAGLIAALSVGCAHPAQKKLEGRWQGDTVENVDDEIRAVATGWARGTLLEFAGSTVTITLPAEDPRSADYAIVAEEGSAITVAIQGRAGEEKTRFFVDSEKSLRWDIGDGRAIVMRREL